MLIFILIFMLLIDWCKLSRDEVQELSLITQNEVQKRIERYHFLLALKSSAQDLLKSLAWLYRNESSLQVGIYDHSDGNPIPWERTVAEMDKANARLIFFTKKERDRKCLLSGNQQNTIRGVPIMFKDLDDVMSFLNQKCFFFVDIKDDLTKAGKERKRILQNLYKVPKPASKKITCERIQLPKNDREFVRKYLYRSKPVIIENGIAHWDALSKWTNDFLRSKYQHIKVHVKLTPKGEFEGCDSAHKFEDFDSFKVPNEVKQQLLYPDLVVVRPAVGNMKFSKFLDLIENKDNPNNISAYLEYSSIREYFSELEDDIHEMPFVTDILKLSHLNIWLSNGHTLGKLHFDPFDNFLCQLRGNKRLTLFDYNHNYNLYEAHIQEALLGYDKQTQKFRNEKLLDSTSMVMSPVNILKPDFDRFPNFTRAYSMECYLNEGDVLYMPAYWWHEVQSYPNLIEKRNLAVNFWYEPFLTKEFPCPECKMDINRFYRHLLEKFT